MRTWCVGQMQLLLAAAVVVAAVAACGTASPDAAPRKASELTAAGVHREEPPADALADATLAGMKAFGYDLFRASAEPTGNFVISPLSVAYAFAMARAGARGDTADQIDEVTVPERRRSRRFQRHHQQAGDGTEPGAQIVTVGDEDARSVRAAGVEHRQRDVRSGGASRQGRVLTDPGVPVRRGRPGRGFHIADGYRGHRRLGTRTDGRPDQESVRRSWA
jgi:Serpin (serine protease inhibitor)